MVQKDQHIQSKATKKLLDVSNKTCVKATYFLIRLHRFSCVVSMMIYCLFFNLNKTTDFHPMMQPACANRKFCFVG